MSDHNLPDSPVVINFTWSFQHCPKCLMSTWHAFPRSLGGEQVNYWQEWPCGLHVSAQGLCTLTTALHLAGFLRTQTPHHLYSHSYLMLMPVSGVVVLCRLSGSNCSTNIHSIVTHYMWSKPDTMTPCAARTKLMIRTNGTPASIVLPVPVKNPSLA